MVYILLLGKQFHSLEIWYMNKSCCLKCPLVHFGPSLYIHKWCHKYHHLQPLLHYAHIDGKAGYCKADINGKENFSPFPYIFIHLCKYFTDKHLLLNAKVVCKRQAAIVIIVFQGIKFFHRSYERNTFKFFIC